MDVSRVGAYESFIRKRISEVITNALGNLGGFGVAILKVKDLHALRPGIGKEVRETRELPALIRKNLDIIIGTGWVLHSGED
jgi:hypothetical protein